MPFSKLRRWLRQTAFIGTLLGLLFSGWAASPVQAACNIQGRVYRDYNSNGALDAREAGQGGVTVSAYYDLNADGISEQIATTTSQTSIDPLQSGLYTLPVTSPDGQVRLEFSGLPNALFSGRFGGNSATTVAFVDCTGGAPVTNVNLAVSNPGEYCHTANPDLATSCYVVGDQFAAGAVNQPTFVSFPYNAGAVTGTAPYGAGSLYDQPAHPVLSTAPQTGSVYGVAYQSTTDLFYAASFVKRHAGLGPGATGQPTTGAIYSIARTGAVNLLVDLNAAGFNTGADTHPATGSPAVDWLVDTNTFGAVGRLGLGDLDISENDNTLYTINLNQGTLISIPINNPGGATSTAIPNPGCVNGIPRPFGLGVKDTLVYIGGVCDASTGTAANLDAYVLTYNPLNGAFAVVLRFDLDYPRRCADAAPACGAGAYRSADWHPWINNWTQPPGGVVVYPQPMLVDIEFDQGNLILGLRDRLGDQTGHQSRSTNAADPAFYSGIAAGDILRACADGAGGWALEQNATCGGVTTAGSGGDFVGQGPGNPGGEYYYTDNNALTPYAQRHDEIVTGGIFQLPGAPDVVVNVFDPVPNDGQLFDGGVVWMNNADGTRTRNYRIFNGAANDTNFSGKTNGLGGLEVACGPSPLEIGNRVWEDLDRDGIQDPGEQPLGGVIVQLYMDTNGDGVINAADPNPLIGQTTTTGAGEYYFNESNVFNGAVNGVPNAPRPDINFADIDGDGTRDLNEPTGILANRVYEIRFDNPANYGGGPLTGYLTTPATQTALNDGNDPTRDSDGTNPTPLMPVDATNFPVRALVTGGYGDNDHTFDFGFSLPIPTPTPTATSTPTLTPTTSLTPSAIPSSTVTPVTPSPTPAAGPGFIVGKSVDPPFAQPGQIITWTMTITNPYPLPAYNVIVSDTVPDALEIIPPASDNSSSGTTSINGQTVTFTQGVLKAGETVIVTVMTRLRDGATGIFQISNSVVGSCCDGFTTGASARVMRVGRLPSTGESPWETLRLSVLATVIGAGVVTLWLVRRRKKIERG